MRWGMLIESDLCVGCRACVTACKVRWDLGPEARRDWVRELERGDRASGLELTFYPGLCMQCEAHPCTSDCPTGATYQDENGVVVVDPELCIGCGSCVSNCPYGARVVDEVKGIVEKCNLCKPAVLRGLQPACVQTCLAECRTFGDLDDPSGPLVQKLRARDGRQLVTEQTSLAPKVFFAPPEKAAHIVAAGAVGPHGPSALTGAWVGGLRPLAQYAVPAIAAAAVGGGIALNLRAPRRAHGAEPPTEQAEGAAPDAAPASAPEAAEATPSSAAEATPSSGEVLGAAAQPPDAPSATPRRVVRHALGMRFLHWFNAVSWLVLLASGTGLLATEKFALFGVGYPTWIASRVGGASGLLTWHVLWGLAWASVIIPLFLYYKRGGIEAIREVWLTRDDFAWLLHKPRVLLGVRGAELPPQDKYNAGQKLFAMAILVATTLIVASGVVMTFHLGGPAVVQSAIALHQLAIMLVLAGLAVHLTMAVIMADERPALRSMVRGDIDREHAAAHSAKWLREVEDEPHAPTQARPESAAPGFESADDRASGIELSDESGATPSGPTAAAARAAEASAAGESAGGESAPVDGRGPSAGRTDTSADLVAATDADANGSGRADGAPDREDP